MEVFRYFMVVKASSIDISVSMSDAESRVMEVSKYERCDWVGLVLGGVRC